MRPFEFRGNVDHRLDLVDRGHLRQRHREPDGQPARSGQLAEEEIQGRSPRRRVGRSRFLNRMPTNGGAVPSWMD